MITVPMPPVVVGVDGTCAGLTAVAAGAKQALMYGLELRLVHVCNWMPTMSPDRPRRPAAAVLAEAIGIADDVAPGVTLRTRLQEGEPSMVLLREARTATMIVVGDGWLCHPGCPPIDACALQLAGRAQCNVMVTRAIPHEPGPIVVGVDDSSTSGRVLTFAFNAAARCGTDVVAVRAEDPEATDEELADLSAKLRAAVQWRETAYGRAAHIVTARGDPADALLHEAENAGLLVVGVRGDRPYGGLPGSVTQVMLHHAPSPVVVVRRPLLLNPPMVRRRHRKPQLTSTA